MEGETKFSAKMKIALIFLNNNDTHPPMGLAYLASYLLRDIPDISIRIIDSCFNNIREELFKENFDLVGISAMTIEYGDALKLARQIKEEKNIPIIIGGVHISTLPISFKDCFDLGIISEGEQTFTEVIKSFVKFKKLNYSDLMNIDGLVFYKNNTIHVTQTRKFIEPLDSIPLPAWSLVNKNYFRKKALVTFGEFGRHGVILTSRGCPYNCVFCSTRKFWYKVRFHTPEYVIKQISDLATNYKVSHIQIWDDLFVSNIVRLKEIVALFESSGLKGKVKFNCQPRANLINNEICELLKRMDCNIVLFGFESGSDRMLKYLKGGNVTVEQNQYAIKTCVKHGLKVQGSVIFGSPTETLEDMKKTLNFIDFAHANGANRIWSFVMTPFPATEMWEIAKARNAVNDDMDWGLLSHDALKNPLLLDPSVEKDKFREIFLQGRRKLNRFKWNKVVSFIKSDPLSAVTYFMSMAFLYLKAILLKK